MRRVLLAVVIASIVTAWPAQAQVSQDGLAPFVGKYTDTPGLERNNVYITSSSALIMTWHFGTGCAVNPAFPCDPANTPMGNLPGGMATAVLWRAEGGELVGDVLSTNQADWVDTGPIRVMLFSDGKIGVRQNDTVRVFDRVR